MSAGGVDVTDAGGESGGVVARWVCGAGGRAILGNRVGRGAKRRRLDAGVCGGVICGVWICRVREGLYDRADGDAGTGGGDGIIEGNRVRWGLVGADCERQEKES
jgi:hypothetical protein